MGDRKEAIEITPISWKFLSENKDFEVCGAGATLGVGDRKEADYALFTVTSQTTSHTRRCDSGECSRCKATSHTTSHTASYEQTKQKSSELTNNKQKTNNTPQTTKSNKQHTSKNKNKQHPAHKQQQTASNNQQPTSSRQNNEKHQTNNTMIIHDP